MDNTTLLKSEVKINENEIYQKMGYIVCPKTILNNSITQLLDNFCNFVRIESGENFTSAFDVNLCNYITTHRHFQSHVYDKIRETNFLKEFAFSCGVTALIKKLHPFGMYLLEKIIFRIDTPLELNELAVWHQDYYYVQGNTEVITAWVPLQEVNYFNGCLSVMPKSHLYGPIPHTRNILGKKYSPENIYTNEIRYVEMNVTDCLLFHSLLLHSGNFNLSNNTRYSVQIRFSPIGYDLPPAMGQAILI